MLVIGEPKLFYVTNSTTPIATTLNEACGNEAAWLCRKVFEWTDNSDLAGIATWLVDRPVKVVIIVLIALLARRVVHRAIDGLIERLMSERSTEERDAVAAAEAATGTLRRELLAEKLASLTRANRASQTTRKDVRGFV